MQSTIIVITMTNVPQYVNEFKYVCKEIVNMLFEVSIYLYIHIDVTMMINVYVSIFVQL